ERVCRHEGLAAVRRTELPIDAEPRADAVVLDTIGELAQLYQIATVVFVGGSLVPAGGHNILEPALYGKPIVFGPYMQNFGEIAEAFLGDGAASIIASSASAISRRAAAAKRLSSRNSRVCSAIAASGR